MKDRARVLRDIWNFLLLYKEFKWGRQIIAAGAERMLKGGYSMKEWK